MPDTTGRLGLSLLVEGTTGVASTNESLVILDAFACGVANSRSTTAQPGSPSDGDVYILGGSPTGTHWSTQANTIAIYDNGWRFVPRVEGMMFWIADTNEFAYYNGSSWLTWKQAGAVADLTYTGTPGSGTSDVGGAFNQTTLNNNFATLASKVNALMAALRTAGLMAP